MKTNKIKLVKKLKNDIIDNKTILSINNTNITNNPNNKLIQKKNLNIYSWNISGLRSIIKKSDFKDFLNNENPDILCLNETKIDKELEKDFNYLCGDNYYSFFNSCSTKKGYSGVAVYTKLLPINVFYGIKIQDKNSLESDNNEQGRVITLEYNEFYLISSYFPTTNENTNGINYRINYWDTNFKKYTDLLILNNKPIIWIGDCNIIYDIKDVYQSKLSQKNFYNSYNEIVSFNSIVTDKFIDTFRMLNKDIIKFTYWSYMRNSRNQNKGWRLDYAFISKEHINKVVKSNILDNYYGSDHCPIMIEYSSC